MSDYDIDIHPPLDLPNRCGWGLPIRMGQAGMVDGVSMIEQNNLAWAYIVYEVEGVPAEYGAKESQVGL